MRDLAYLWPLLTVLSFSIFAGNVSGADSYNIDFGTANAAPSSAFGANAGQPGVWNRITSSSNGALTNLAGVTTSAHIVVNAGDFGGLEIHRSGDLMLMLDDFFYSTPGNFWAVSITGLANGTYDFYYYAPSHQSVDSGTFSVNGVQATNLLGSTAVSGTVQGVDWQVLHNVVVTDGTMTTLWNDSGTGSHYSGLSGIQIVAPVTAIQSAFIVTRDGTNLDFSWPTASIGWRLISQTNNLARGISTNIADWGTISNSANTNRILVPIDPNKAAGFFRLAFP